MRRFWIIFVLLALILVSGGASLNDAEKAEFTTYMDFAGSGPELLHQVGIENVAGEYQLKYYQWRNGELVQDVILDSSSDRLLWSKVTSEGQQLAISYFKEVEGTLRLHLVTNYNNQWHWVNSGAAVNRDLSHSIEKMEMVLKGEDLFVTFVQNGTLQFLKVDASTGTYYQLHQEELGLKQLTSLKLVSYNQEPIYAYTYTEFGQEILKVGRVRVGGFIDWVKEVYGVNSYDLGVHGNRLLLAYELFIGAEAQITLQEANQGIYSTVATMVRQDLTPEGLRLLVNGSEPALLFREKGIREPYDLYVTQLAGSSWTTPELVEFAGTHRYLSNLRENLNELNAEALVIRAKDLHWMGRQGLAHHKLIYLTRSIAPEQLASGFNLNHTQKMALNTDLTPAQVRNFALYNPTSIITDQDGYVYLLDAFNSKIWKLNTDGTMADHWSVNDQPMVELTDFAFDGAGYLYVTDRANNRILRYTRGGELVQIWGSKGNVAFEFNQPIALAIDRIGNIYVLEEGSQQVVKFDSRYNLLARWGGMGAGPGQFNNPRGIALDAAGHIYVADTGNNRVQVFDSTGNYLNQTSGWGTDAGKMIEPVDLAIDGDKLYIADRGNYRIQVLGLNLQYQYEFGDRGSHWGEFRKLNNIYIDSQGVIYITDGVNHSLQKISPNYYVLHGWRGADSPEIYSALESVGVLGNTYYVWNQQIQTLLTYDWDLNFKAEIKLSDQGQRLLSSFTCHGEYLYFTDILNHAVVVNDLQGNLITSFGGLGSLVGELNHPLGIAVDEHGLIYVADTGNHRIQKFSVGGEVLQVWGSLGTGNGQFIEPQSLLWQEGKILVADLALNRVQSFSDTGQYMQSWNGFGEGEGRLGYTDYLRDELKSKSENQLLTLQYSLELSDDLNPKKRKEWKWTDRVSYRYRYSITANPTDSPTSPYSNISSAVINYGNGEYYLHIQVCKMDWFGMSILDESEVYHYKAVLDNTAPTVTMPASQTTPKQSVTLTWQGADNITSSLNTVRYKHRFSQRSPDEWNSNDELTWNAITFFPDSTATFSSGTGRYYLVVQAIDSAGNISTRQFSSVALDNTKPTVNDSIVAVANNRMIYTIQAGDVGSEADELQYRCVIDRYPDTLPTGAYTSSQTFDAAYQSGENYIHAQVKDAAGNVSDVFHKKFNLEDITIPLVTGLSNLDTPVKQYIWNWSGTDDSTSTAELVYSASISFKDTEIPTADFSAVTTKTIQNMPDGLYYLNVQAKDKAGNLSVVKSVYVTIDTTPPTLDLTKLTLEGVKNAQSGIFSDLVKVTIPTTTYFDQDPNVSVFYKINSDSYTVYTEPFNVTREGVNTLTVQVRDSAGNSSESSTTLTIDKNPPLLTSPIRTVMESTWYRLAQTLTIGASDSPAGVKSIQYNLNNTTWTTVTNNGTLTVSGEGSHSLQIKLTDNVDKQVTETIPVNIDLTNPVIQGISSETHLENQWTWRKSGDFTVTASDNLSQVKEYRYVVNSEADLTAFIQNQYQSTATNQIHLTNLSDGINYLHVQAVDNAGNTSTMHHYKLMITDETPVVPTIYSDTHTNNGTSLYTNPHFYWRTPDAGNLNYVGIVGYEYVLTKIQNSLETVISTAETINTEVSLAELAPLSAAEGYYQFELRSINAARKKSAYANFRFNISDLSNESTLKVLSNTHPSSDCVYNQPEVQVHWNNPGQPQSQFYDQLQTSNTPLATEWSGVTGLSNTVTLPQTSTGSYYYWIKRVAGTSVQTSNTHQVRLDLEKPEVAAFTVTVDPVQKSATVYWNSATDSGGAGLSEIRVTLTALGDPRGVYRANTTDAQYVLTNLQSTETYEVILEVIDGAGNRRVRSATFNLLEGVTYPVGEQNDYTVAGWAVTATTNLEQITAASVAIPAAYNFAIKQGDTYIGTESANFTLADLINENFTGMNSTVQYQIDLSGLTFVGEGLYINDTGLYLEEIRLNAPEAFWNNAEGVALDENKQFVFTDVKLLATNGNKVVGTYQHNKANCVYTGSWPLTVEQVTLTEIGLHLGGTAGLADAYVNSPVTYTNLALDVNFALVSGNLTAGYTITLPDTNQLQVNISQLFSEHILVTEALLNFTDTTGNHSIRIGNFTIDREGMITQLENFYSDALQCTYGTAVYNFAANQLTFINGMLYFDEGQVTINGQTYVLDNIQLNNQADQLVDADDIVTHITGKIKDIDVDGYSGTINGNLITFERGIIHLPIEDDAQNEVDLMVSGLQYNTTTNTFSLTGLTILTTEFDYAGMFTIKVGTLTENTTGLSIAGEVVFKPHMPTGLAEEVLDIDKMTVTATGGVTALEVKLKAEETLTLYNTYEFSADKLYFRRDEDMQSVYFTGGTVKFIGPMAIKLSDEVAVANIVEIENTGEVVKFDTTLQTLSYNLLGMAVNLYTEEIDENIISFGGNLSLPIAFPGQLSGMQMRIYDLTMDHNTGEVISFSAYVMNREPIVISGWSFQLYGITFANNEYRFMASLKLPSTGRIAEILPQLAGKYVDIREFVLDSTGSVKAFDVKIPLQFEFDLVQGVRAEAEELGVSMTEGSLSNLALGFTRTAIHLPADLGGGTLSVSNLTINASGAIQCDNIQLTNQTLSFKDVASVYISSATVNSEAFRLNGTITLGTAFPEGLANQQFSINNLTITSAGITTFSVGIDLSNPIELFDAVAFSANSFAFTETGLEIRNGKVYFIGDLAEATTSEQVDLTEFVVSYTGQITAFNAGFSNLDFDVFGCAVNLSTLQFTNNYVEMNGTVNLPENFPGSLSTQSININKLQIAYTGEILDYKVGVSNVANPLSFNLNGLTISFTGIAIDQTGFAISATCTLSNDPALPASLRGLAVTVTNLKINHSYQVEDFQASLTQDVQFNLGQLDFSVTELTVLKTKMEMKGNVQLPSTYPGGLADKVISFNKICMDYSGKILETDISLSKLSFAMGQYITADLHNFAFVVNNGVTSLQASKLEVAVKSPVNTTINFTKVSLDQNGTFTAEVDSGVKIDIPLAGTTLRLALPKLTKDGVEVSSAELILPDVLGSKKVSVSDVLISPDHGLQIGGGTFGVTFPDMTLGQVGIQNAYLILQIENNKFVFEGNGKANIPGVGQLGANVRLRSVTRDFPRGIESIEIAFKSDGLGLAVGTTGLYINGVEGTFAEGPVPSDSPAVVKKIGAGMRFSLRLLLRDASNSLNGLTGFWVNISNTNVGVFGQVELLSDLIDTTVYAAITEHFSDFYAEANISILNGTVQGNSTFHMWKVNKTSYLTGSAVISVLVEKGRILNSKFVKLPPSSVRIPNLGAEFGNFKNNVKGVKGFIGKLPIVGQVGFFAGNIGLKLGGVSQYVLIDRAGTEFKMVYLDPASMVPFTEQILTIDGNFIIGDREYISFVLPGEHGLPRNETFALTASPDELQNYYVQSTERVIFAVGFEYGDPEVIAISPTGQRYTKDSLGVEYLKEANQVLMSVPNPEPGLWHVELENARGLNYEIAILGTTPKPEIIITSPAREKEAGSNSYLISGRGGTFTGKDVYVDLYYDTDNQNFDGRPIAEGVLLQDFLFSQEWDTSALPTGEYYIYGKLYDDGDLPPVLAYANGTISVTNHESIVPPDEIRAVVMDNEIQLLWDAVSNPNITGYKLYYGSESGVYEHELNLGLLSKAILPLPENGVLYLTVAAYNKSGAVSEFAPELKVEQVAVQITEFNLDDVQLPETLHMYIGEGEELAIPYTALGLPTNTAGDYFTAELKNLPEGVYVNYDQPMYNLYADAQVINLTILTESKDVVAPEEEEKVLLHGASPTAGEVNLELTSVGNPELKVTRTINLVLEYRDPRVYEHSPTQVVNTVDEILTITGDNFREGAEVFLGSQPLTVLSVDKHLITAQVDEGFPAGVYDLTIQNDDGKKVMLKEGFEVKAPNFLLSAKPAQLLIAKGSGGNLYFGAEAVNGFTGQILLQSGDVPTGLRVTTNQPNLNCGGEVTFEVSAGYDTPAGEYLLDFTGTAPGLTNSVKVLVQVLDGAIEPSIENLAKPFALTTEPMVVYGQGFGHSGKVYLNEQELSIISWGYNRVEFMVPEGATTGSLVVEAGGLRSAPVELIVKEKKYTVSVHPKVILINRGDSMKVNFAVTGFSDPIDFTLEGIPAGMSYTLPNATAVVPNRTLGCELVTDAGMELGEYTLELVSRVGEVIKRLPVQVVVAELPEILNHELAEGRVGALYRDWIEVEGGFLPYQYEVMQNSLPSGLRIHGNGSITGTPQEAGTYNVLVKVTDSVGSMVQLELPLQVMGDEWIYPLYDAGGSGFAPGAGPAAEDHTFAVNMTGEAERLLSSDDYIIALGGSTVSLYSKEDGSLVEQITLGGNVVDAVVLKEKLVVLSDTATLMSYHFTEDTSSEISLGFSGSGSLFLYRDQLVVASSTGIQFRSKANFSLVKEYAVATPMNTLVKGVLQDWNYFFYVNSANQVVGVDLRDARIVATLNMASAVTRLTGVQDGILILKENGQVEKFISSEGRSELLIEHGAGIQHFVPYGEGYLLGDETRLVQYGANGKYSAELVGSFAKVIVAGKRLYTVGSGGISSYKLPNLAEVWTVKGRGQQLLLSEHNLYVTAEGQLYKFAAPTNVHPPVTALHTRPKEIDGDNGYYRQEVVVYLEASDRDNEVMVTYYALNGGDYEVYQGGIVLSEGAHTVQYYSLDEEQMLEIPQVANFRVDYTTPVVSVSADLADGANGWYQQDVVQVALAAEDNFSGVKEIYYRVDGGEYQLYQGQFIVQGEARHLVEYYATDVAGNVSEVHSFEVNIDHTIPEVSLLPMAVDGKNGYYVTVPVHQLSGTDNVSGIAQLYYAINEGGWQEYVDGIRIDDGEHEIRYYGVDLAGNASEVLAYSCKVDSTPAETTVVRVKPLVNGLVVNVRLTATDNFSGVETIHYQVDGGELRRTDGDINLTDPGEHTITYYAEDYAGNLETPHQLTCYVKSLDEVEFIAGVKLTEFHNNLTKVQPYEMERKVEVGERIYLDEEYIFESLPEYLSNARYLRTNRHANQVGSYNHYLEFKALVNLKVYLVVEASVTEIPGFTLVSQTRFAERMHFSGVQNVFVQQVSGNTEVRIPRLDIGHAPLVFLQYDARGTFAEIEQLVAVKRGGQWYYDFSGSGFDNAEGVLEGQALEWSWTRNGVTTRMFGDAGTLPIEFTAEPYTLELVLTATNSKGVQAWSRRYLLIADQSGVYLLQPGEMDKFAPASSIVLRGERRDELGQRVAANLTWEWRHDAATGWVSLGTGEHLTVIAPDRKGEYHLRLSDGVDTVMVKIVVMDNKNERVK